MLIRLEEFDQEPSVLETAFTVSSTRATSRRLAANLESDHTKLYESFMIGSMISDD